MFYIKGTISMESDPILQITSQRKKENTIRMESDPANDKLEKREGTIGIESDPTNNKSKKKHSRVYKVPSF